MRILIIGGGIAGLSAALRLRQLGLPATVVEAAPGPRGGGYMIDFLGLGVAAADRLGVTPQLERLHSPVARLVFVDETGGTRAAIGYPAMRRRMFAGRHYNLLRGDLEALLHRIADGVGAQIQHGRGVTGVTPAQERRGPVVVRFADGAEEEWDVVLGADGLHSPVRASLLAADEWATRDLGHAVWAWIVAGSVPEVPAGDFTTLTAPGRMAAAYPAGPDRTATLFLVRSPRHGGEPAEQVPAVLHELFGDLDWRVPSLLATFPRAIDRYTDRTVQVHTDVWHRGRVGLVGDACWCVSLLAGQGASLAMAGGVAVAEELAATPDDVPAALERYRARLQPTVGRLAASGARTAAWFVPEERWRMAIRDLALRAGAWPGIGPLLGRQLGYIRAAV